MDRNALISLYEQHAGRAGGALALVLAVLCGITFARLAWALVPLPPDPWRAPPATRAASGNEAGPSFDLEQIVAAELFGKWEPPEEVPEEQDVEDAPETQLSLRLLGVWAADEPSLSRAIIASSRNDEEIYAVDDTISRGVTLHSIFPDRVIISRAGTLETLRMERDAAEVETVAMRNAGADDASGDTIAAPDPQQLGTIRDELLQDPSQAGNYIRVVPASSGGQQRGYRIYPGRDRSLFSAAGLRPGDLVTAVNGIDLDDPARALQLLNELSNANSINVTVERGGNVQNYTLSTN